MAGRQVAPDKGSNRRVSEIRLIALAEIVTGTTGLSHRGYHQELDANKTRPLTEEWLEAYIMMSVIARSRPSRTIAFLRQLRTIYTEQAEPETFDRFDARLRDYLAPDTLTNHGYHSNTFGDIAHDSVWRQVTRHLGALEAAGHTVFLNSGTLLGVVRDAQLIDNDDDIDLAVLLPARTAKEAAEQWLAMEQALIALDLLEGTVEGMPGIYKLRPAGAVEIDLFPAWTQDGQVFVYPHTFGTLATADLLPLQSCPVTGQNIPANPARMLESNYGTDWTTPDPLFKFPWGNARKQFAAFLNEVAA